MELVGGLRHGSRDFGVARHGMGQSGVFGGLYDYLACCCGARGYWIGLAGSGFGAPGCWCGAHGCCCGAPGIKAGGYAAGLQA